MGKLAVLKTKQTGNSVQAFLDTVTDEQKRTDSLRLLALMEKLSKEKPRMWGASMIGFGLSRYKSAATGREVDWFKIGFSPRKANLSLHMVGNLTSYAPLLEKLGRHKTSAGCIYIQKLEDIDMKVLEGIVKLALAAKGE